MSNLRRMGFIPVRPNKREQRMNKALDRIYNRKVSEISLGDGYYRHKTYLKRCTNAECAQRLDWSKEE